MNRETNDSGEMDVVAPLDQDREARIAAIDPLRSFLVQAPAGSGKTTLLTERLLNLLLHVNEPEEVLAITFTRKAAAEMHERLIAALRASGAAPAEHLRRAWSLGQRVRERSRERGWALEYSASRLRVQTIDALNLGIAAQLPIAAGTGGQVRVSTDNEELYYRAAQRLLEHAESEPQLRPHFERLLARADNDWQRLLATFAQMLPLRGHWLPHLQPDHASLLQRIEQSLRSLIVATLQRALEGLGSERLQAAPGLLAQAAENLPPLHAGQLAHWRQSAPTLRADAAQLGHWQELARFALTKKRDKLRARLDKNVGFANEAKTLKHSGLAWLATLGEVGNAVQLLDDVAELPPPQFDADDAQALESSAVLLQRGTAELHLLFAEAGTVDHTFVAGAARQALWSAGDPTNLALRLGNRLRHILVDEYQDTSGHQVRLLEQLTADWQNGDGRTVFLVGDPMQSIYLFRESDVGLFLQAKVTGLGQLRLEPLALRRNFRSRADLVQFNNACFSQLFPAVASAPEGAVPYLSSVASREGSAAVQNVHLIKLDSGDARAEAARIRDIVRENLARDSQCKIAVLVRSRIQSAPITAALLEAGIAVAGVDLVPLAEVGVIQDLSVLTRALRHDGDRIAWLALLRSPCCGLSLTDLEALVGADPQRTVRELTSDPQRIRSLSAAGQAQLRRLQGVVNDRTLLDIERPGVLAIETVWRALGGPAACASELELKNASRFFELLARRVAEQGWPDAEELDAMLGRLYAEPAPGLVQVMTIHKSKGLEFDVVIVPGLQRAARSGDAALMRWIELPRRDAGNHVGDDGSVTELLLAPSPPADEENTSALWNFIGRLRRRRESHEQLRLLYVAFTRARESLYLLSALPDADAATPRSGSSLAKLWPALGAEFLAQVSTPTVTAAPRAAMPALRRLPADWCQVWPDRPIAFGGVNVARVEVQERPEYFWVGRLGRRVGTVVHAEMQRAARLGPPAYEAQLAQSSTADERLRRALRGAGIEEPDTGPALARVRSALQTALRDPRGRWILGAEHREAHSEFALSGLQEGKLTQAVVDRWLIDNNGDCWVIDYKTSAHEGSAIDEFIENEMRRYAPQLQRYRALSRALGQQRIRAALYFPLLGRFEELL